MSVFIHVVCFVKKFSESTIHTQVFIYLNINKMYRKWCTHTVSSWHLHRKNCVFFFWYSLLYFNVLRFICVRLLQLTLYIWYRLWIKNNNKIRNDDVNFVKDELNFIAILQWEKDGFSVKYFYLFIFCYVFTQVKLKQTIHNNNVIIYLKLQNSITKNFCILGNG